MLSSEYCKIFQDTYFEEHLPTAASECETFLTNYHTYVTILSFYRKTWVFFILSIHFFSKIAYYLNRLSRALLQFA